jgi:hypothetical protein
VSTIKLLLEQPDADIHTRVLSGHQWQLSLSRLQCMMPRHVRKGLHLVGCTALHRAAATGSVDKVRVLIEAGASTSCRNAHAETPLRTARRAYGHIPPALKAALAKQIWAPPRLTAHFNHPVHAIAMDAMDAAFSQLVVCEPAEAMPTTGVSIESAPLEERRRSSHTVLAERMAASEQSLVSLHKAQLAYEGDRFDDNNGFHVAPDSSLPIPREPVHVTLDPAAAPRAGDGIRAIACGKDAPNSTDRLRRAAVRMRDPGYALREFHDDMIACFPELRLYLANPIEELGGMSLEPSKGSFSRFEERLSSTSGRSAIEEYQRTIGALFAVYWFARADMDGKVSLCFGVDEKWLPPSIEALEMLTQSSDATHKRQAAVLSKLDWKRLQMLFVDADLLLYGDGLIQGVNIERMTAMLALTAVHDIMKLSMLCPCVLPEHAPYAGHEAGESIQNHDIALSYVLEHDVEALPCIARLSKEQQAAVRFTQAEMGYNHGWLVQAEAPPGMLLSKLKTLITHEGASTADVAFYFVHWITDISGAVPAPLRGAEQFTLLFPITVLSGLVNSLHVVQQLVEVSESELMEEHLKAMWLERSESLRAVPPTGPESIALMRLVVQAQTHLGGLQVVNAMASLSEADRETLAFEMALTGIEGQMYERSPHRGGPAILVYYSPAFLRNMLQQDALLALHALAEIYRAARTIWPLAESGGVVSTTKTVLIGSLTKRRAKQLTGSSKWKLIQTGEQSATVDEEETSALLHTTLFEPPASDERRREALSFVMQESTDKVDADASVVKGVIIAVLTLSYLDLASDVILACVNFQIESIRGYAYASLGAITLSLMWQGVLTKSCYNVSWCSKDVLLALMGLAPAISAYHLIFPSTNHDKSIGLKRYTPVQMLGIFKGAEVLFESLPETILQLSLLTVDPINWTRPELIVSLAVSIIAAAILIVDAEKGINGVQETRDWYEPYFGYLPAQGPQRWRVLCCLTLFEAAYLPMFASCIIAASSWVPWVLIASLCVHFLHLHWSGSLFVATYGTMFLSIMSQAFVFFGLSACPLPVFRDPIWSGPQHYARVVLSTFGIVFATVISVLSSEPRASDCLTTSSGCSATALMVARVTLPTFIIALTALTGFMYVIGPQYRWTFYWPDDRRKLHRRNWEHQHDDAVGDARRALRMMEDPANLQRHAPDLVAVWLMRRKHVWVSTQPEWLTEAWWAKVPAECRGDMMAVELGLQAPPAAVAADLSC